jgi:hypothetical protein
MFGLLALPLTADSDIQVLKAELDADGQIKIADLIFPNSNDLASEENAYILDQLYIWKASTQADSQERRIYLVGRRKKFLTNPYLYELIVQQGPTGSVIISALVDRGPISNSLPNFSDQNTALKVSALDVKTMKAVNMKPPAEEDLTGEITPSLALQLALMNGPITVEAAFREFSIEETTIARDSNIYESEDQSGFEIEIEHSPSKKDFAQWLQPSLAIPAQERSKTPLQKLDQKLFNAMLFQDPEVGTLNLNFLKSSKFPNIQEYLLSTGLVEISAPENKRRHDDSRPDSSPKRTKPLLRQEL